MNKNLKYSGLSAFFLLLFAYSFYDAMNSGNSGASDENRGVVYIYLLMMLGWNAIYLLQTKVISQRKNSIIPIMIGIATKNKSPTPLLKYVLIPSKSFLATSLVNKGNNGTRNAVTRIPTGN